MATQAPSSRKAPFTPLQPVETDTLAKLFFRAIDRLDLTDALRYRDGDAWKPLSHREVLTRVTHLAAALDALGVGRGDRVGLLSENRPEWLIADFAVLCLGAADVPVYATLPPNQIAYILKDAGVKAMFVSTRAQLEKILEIGGEVGLEHVFTFDDAGGAPGVRSLRELLEEGRRRVEAGEFGDLRERALTLERDDLATLIYTSGTTGDPKGVMLTHYNLASNVAATEQHGIFAVGTGDVGLSFLPLSHAFERMVGYYYWNAGTTIALLAELDRLPEALLEVRPNVAAAAPRVFEKIYARVMGASGVRGKLIAWAKHVGEKGVEARLRGEREGPAGFQEKLADRLVFSKLRARTGGRIRAFASGSAPLSAEIARFFWAAGLPVYEGYGLTETSPVLTVNRPGQVRLGTVGVPLPGTEIRLAESGEILARGPQVMKGYYQRPDATAEAVDADGWFHTGDVGEIDADGFLRITDRIKNLIVTAGGKNVAPAPMENEAAMSPYVEQVVMIGDRRPFPILLVVPDYENLTAWARANGVEASDPERLAREPRVQSLLEQETLGRLHGFARYELPKKILVIPEEFTVERGELTPTLKVKRRVVEEHYGDRIEELYAHAHKPGTE